MMDTWVKKMRNKFEKRNENNENKFRRNNGKGIVKLRTQFYESHIKTNRPNQNQSADKSNHHSISSSQSSNNINGNNSEESIDTKSSSPDISNIDKMPRDVVNDENICIYNDPDNDSLYASFRKRPKFHRSANVKNSDKDVMLRLKVVENEFQNTKRYESILRPPLFQEVVVSKHKDEIQNIKETKPKKNSIVASMVEVFNQQSNNNNNNNNQQEKLIDLDIINSIRKEDKFFSNNYKEDNNVKKSKLMDELVGKRNVKWVEMTQVQSKNLASQMSKEEIKFQESQFEIMSSEASYNRSLGVLIDKFYNAPQMSLIATDDFIPKIKPYQKEHLFSNILKIYTVSSKFLFDLENKFSEFTKISNLCDIVSRYAEKDFDVYIPYLQNQRFQTETYNELNKEPSIAKIIKELEDQPECCFLSLDSFLILPMQRLLRILLLLKAVKAHVAANKKHVMDSVDRSIINIEKILQKCTDNKNHIDERKRMLEICRDLVFKSGQPKVIISTGKLIYESEVKRCKKNVVKPMLLNFLAFKDIWMILTSEYLLMTKASKSKDTEYVVEQYHSSSDVTVDLEDLPLADSQLQFKIVVRNQNNVIDRYLVQTKTKEDWTKWISALQSLWL